MAFEFFIQYINYNIKKRNVKFFSSLFPLEWRIPLIKINKEHLGIHKGFTCLCIVPFDLLGPEYLKKYSK